MNAAPILALFHRLAAEERTRRNRAIARETAEYFMQRKADILTGRRVFQQRRSKT